MVLDNVFVPFVELNNDRIVICTISDLDRPRLTDTRSGQNGSIRADTDIEYWIGASLTATIVRRSWCLSTCSVQKLWKP